MTIWILFEACKVYIIFLPYTGVKLVLLYPWGRTENGCVWEHGAENIFPRTEKWQNKWEVCMTNFQTWFTSFKIVRKSRKMSSIGYVVYMKSSMCNKGRSNFKSLGFDWKVSLWNCGVGYGLCSILRMCTNCTFLWIW